MEQIKEFSLEEAKEYLVKNNKKQGFFYINVYGWEIYYTLSPTFATPTGKLKDFPRKKLIKV